MATALVTATEAEYQGEKKTDHCTELTHAAARAADQSTIAKYWNDTNAEKAKS